MSTPATPTIPRRLDFSLDAHWPASTWQTFTSRTAVSIRQVVESLGLVIAPETETKRSAPRFEDETVERLGYEIARIAAKMPTEKDILVNAAANEDYLGKETDELIKTFGRKVWGRRDNISENDGEKQMLVFEDEKDREKIRLHLHQWVFLKAFNSWRNAEQSRKARLSKDDDSSSTLKRSPPSSSPSTAQNLVKKRKLVPSPQALQRAGSHTYTQHLRDDLIAEAHETLAASTSTRNNQDLQQTAKLPKAQFKTNGNASFGLELLPRFNLADQLIKFLYGIDKETVKETDVLALLEKEWTRNADLYRRKLSVRYPTLSNIFMAWIAERRTITQLKTSLNDDKIKSHERFLAFNDLRIQRIMWSNIGAEIDGKELPADDMLCLVFSEMTIIRGSVAMEMFRRGLEELGREVDGLNDGHIATNIGNT